MLSNRDEAEARIAAFVGSWLDGAENAYPEGFRIGIFGVAFEVEHAADADGEFAKGEVGYTCSDDREWIHAGLFRRAMLAAEASMTAPARDADDE
jgi:hypothetical protein